MDDQEILFVEDVECPDTECGSYSEEATDVEDILDHLYFEAGGSD